MKRIDFRKEMWMIAAILIAMWGVFLLDSVVPLDFNQWGLLPRTRSGLVGVFTSPFLHGSWGHLIGNTLPLAVLLSLLVLTRDDSVYIVISIAIVSGLLLWLIGSNSVHIGASMVIFGLATFLMSAGFFERRIAAIGVGVLVFFLYGGTLMAGVLPTVGAQVSWWGHLCGAVSGVAVAAANQYLIFGPGETTTGNTDW
ncbi:MAG: rhomboid family intramembrane serine protease [Planctomycetota bacterium]